MRRDIVIGIAASLVIHTAIGVVGNIRNPIPQKPLLPVETVKRIEMKPIEPDKPEPEITNDEPKPKMDLRPPTQPEIFRPSADAPFQQPPQPPAPDGPTAISVTIPVQTGRPSTDGLGEIFSPDKVDHQPEPRFQAKPVYPFDQRRTGVTGQVIVGFVVDANGNVQGAYAVSSSMREFESAAVQAVSKWKFKPGKKGGRAVPIRMQVPIVFSISDDQ